MSLDSVPAWRSRRRLLPYLAALVFGLLIVAGIFAKNNWFPSRPDPFTGKRTGWFGRPVAGNSSGWNPFAPNPTPTPLPLSREYVHAGSKLLSVIDANAQEAPPADLAIWRPSTGQWWVMGQAGSNQVTEQWGSPGDDPLPGDYS